MQWLAWRAEQKFDASNRYYRLCSFLFFYCYPKGCAAPGEVPCQCNTRRLLSKLEKTPPRRKIGVTSKSPFGDISVVTLIRTDTTLDHSQKAEKVCWLARYTTLHAIPCVQSVSMRHVNTTKKKWGPELSHCSCTTYDQPEDNKTE